LVIVGKQDLTEFNTAHNKRISSLGIEEGSANLAGVTSLKRKRRSSLSVAFREGEEIINPGNKYFYYNATVCPLLW